MNGTPSDPAASGTPAARRFDPPVTRSTVRVTNVYGTMWQPVETLDGAGALGAYLRFGRLSSFFDAAVDQLPTVATRETLDPATVTFTRWRGELVGARLWVLVVPSGQSVVAFSIDVDTSMSGSIDLLEDCYYLDVKIDGVPLEEFACRLAARVGVPGADGHGFAPERHQVVFAAELPDEDREDTIQKLIYRSDLPYRPEFSAITYPAELNRRPGASVAVGPYVSVMCGQQDYVENSAFVSAAQAVASAVRLREVREFAYEDVRLFRDAQAASGSLSARRHTLEGMANQLGNLELELSFSVESTADLGILVPSLRVSGYHDALFDCMGLCDKAEIVGGMLQRLERSIAAELTAIESVERRGDEDRRMRWTIAVGFLSTVAVPLTLILAFFGINASEVDGDLSMFDSRYWPIYVGLGLLVIVGLALFAALYLQQRRQTRADAQRATHTMSAVRNMAIIRRRTPSAQLRRVRHDPAPALEPSFETPT